jgi:hypothetical protein
MTKLFKSIAIIAILLLVAVPAMAQDSYLKNRWNLKLAGSPKFHINGKEQFAFLLTEVHYGILNNFELGVALGMERTRVANLKPGASNPPTYDDYYSVDYSMPMYDLNLNYHLLPYLAKDNNSKFDLYLSGRLGGNYIKSNVNDQSFYWNYYLGGGLAWYFTRNIGIYTEYGKQYSLSRNYSKRGFRFGIAVKFY